MTEQIKLAATVLFLPILVFGTAVLIKGYSSTGDGFSGGVIAAIGVLLQYVAFSRRQAAARIPLFPLAPSAALAGLLLMLAVVFFPAIQQDPLLTHMPEPGASVVGIGMIKLHTALLYDAGIFLLLLGTTVSVIDTFVVAAGRTRE